MWVCGRSPHTHIYHSFRLAGGFFGASILIIVQLPGRPRVSRTEIGAYTEWKEGWGFVPWVSGRTITHSHLTDETR